MVKILQHLRMCCLLIVVLVSTALMAQGAPRQEILDIEVTISLKDVTLKQALQEIEAIAKVKFVYSRSYLKLDEEGNNRCCEQEAWSVAGRTIHTTRDQVLRSRPMRILLCSRKHVCAVN